MSDKPNDISKHSRESDVSFIDEKKATKDFV